MPDQSTLFRALNGMHQAALGKEGWAPALNALGDILGVEAVSLEEYPLIRGQHKMYGYSAFEPETIAQYVAHYHAVNPRWKAGLAARPGTVLVDDIVAIGASRKRDEFFNWIEDSSEFTYCMFIKLHHDRERLVALALHRTGTDKEFEPGTAETLKLIAPNLVSIYTTARELEELRARQISGFGMLDRVKFGMGQVSCSGTLHEHNESLRRLFDRSAVLAVDGHGRLTASTASLSTRIEAAISAAFAGQAQSVQFADPRAGSTVLRFLPAPTSNEAPSNFVLLIARGDFVEPIAIDEVRSAFDLGEREAQVALGIVEGKSLDQIAAELHISVATARVHLKNIFSKTDTHRQAQLARKISTALLP